MDEELEGFIDGVRDEFGEVSGFWVVDAEEAIVAFNGAFFPGAVGVAVVDGNMEEVFEGVFVEELGAVVSEDGFEFVAAGSDVAPKVVEMEGRKYM